MHFLAKSRNHYAAFAKLQLAVASFINVIDS